MEKEVKLDTYDKVIEDLRKEIEQEFLDALKNNIINPYEKEIIFGEKFAFWYLGTTRVKNSIRLKFIVYRRNDVEEMKTCNKKYFERLGKIYLTIKVKDND